jgi:TctA family transporter
VPPAVDKVSDSGTFAEVKPLLLRRPWHTLRSTSIGSVIGMLPGAGADIAAWVSLAASKKFSKKKEEYGQGSLDGVADATAANNSAIAGAWIPALVFGIPGDTVTALVISVLYMKKITPGPEIFENPEQRTLVYSIYLLFIAANLVLIPLGLLAIRASTALVRLPQRILLPCVLVFTVVGAFAYRATYFHVGVMLVMGLLGFVLDRHKVPLGPVVLGLVLGGPLEEKLIQGLVASDGSVLAFFSRPGAALLGGLTIALWLSPVILRARRASKKSTT